MSNIDLKRLAEDREYWDSVAPLGATHHWRASGDWYQDCGDYVLAWISSSEKWAPSLAMHRMAQPEIIPRPPQKAQEVEWVDGLPPESIAEFRKALAINLQNSIEAITGELFSDDDSLILAHEIMVKYDLSEKLKFSGD